MFRRLNEPFFKLERRDSARYKTDLVIVTDACDDTDDRRAPEEVGGVILATDTNLQHQRINTDLSGIACDGT